MGYGTESSLFGIVAAVLGIVLILTVVLRMWKKVPQDKAGVVTGMKKRVITGGGGLVIPVFEIIDYISLGNIPLSVATRSSLSSQGVPISVITTAVIKVRNEKNSILTAIEQFTGRNEKEIIDNIQGTAIAVLEGKLREIIATMTVEELYQKREEFSSRVQEVVGTELGNMGLEVKNFTITDISDENGYIKALGDGMIAQRKKDAEIQKAEAARDMQIKTSQARQEGESAKLKAEADIAQAAKDKAVLEANYMQEQQTAQAKAENRVSNKMVATKVVITSPLLGGNLSYGAEYIHTRRNDDYEVNRTDLLANSYSKLEEQTASPFIQYAHLTPIGNITAGLRYEYVRFKYYDAGIYQPEQSRSFRNLFPTISYGAKIGKVMAQLSYSVKTSRPSYSQLSNNVSYMNRFTRQTGNPYLDNETNHRVELSGVWKFIQFMVNYKDSRNAIIYWAEQIPENEAITMISRKNVKSLKSMTAYISAAPKIGIWAPQINLGMQKPWFTLHTDVASYRLNRPIFMGNFNNAFSLSCGITLNVDYRYQSKGNTMNVYLAKEQHVLDVSISKSFLKDALTLEIKGNDLLYKCWDADLLYNQKMELLQVSKRGTRDLQLTLRYKFNTTRSKYKGTGAGNAELNRL